MSTLRPIYDGYHVPVGNGGNDKGKDKGDDSSRDDREVQKPVKKGK